MAVIILAILGLILGSFVSATVWRIHEQTLKNSKKRKEELSIVRGRSMCPSCGHTLSAKDLIPVFSWLQLKGRCRYCKKPIGVKEPVIEVACVALFVLSYYFWPLSFHGGGLFEFVLWLVFLSGFLALVIYDAQWFVLPDRLVYPLLFLAIIQSLAMVLFFHAGTHSLLVAFWGFTILFGLFYLIFQVSQGRWIGGGDVKLGAVLGILVGGPLDAVLLLFMASILGTAVSIPLLVTHKAKKNSRIPFGPFLIVAAIITQLFGASIVAWYKKLYS